jgi:hypothetical protein
MRKTPTTLKWLAEQRGRLAHDLTTTERIAADVNHRLANLRLDLASLDRSIKLYDPSINPADIEPVIATKGRYGARGVLRQTVLLLLKAHAPHWMSTDNLEMMVRLELAIAFETPVERRRWYMGSFKNLLRKFVDAGLIERQHDPETHTQEMGRWRWVDKATPRTLAELRAAATSLPVEIGENVTMFDVAPRPPDSDGDS